MSGGWRIIPQDDEEMIRTAWIAHIQSGDDLIVPTPSLTWRGKALARHRPMVEAEFADKLFDAFRRCTRRHEEIWVIDWQHAWYYFSPHTAGNNRPVPALPSGDSCHYVAPDFRFGVVMGWRETGPVTLFGAELLSAFSINPPKEFLRLCGDGRRKTMTNRNWPDSCESVEESDVQGLVAELQWEVNDQHPLSGCDVAPLAWNFRCDDVLFEVRGKRSILLGATR